MKKEIVDFIEKVIYYILGLTVLFFIILKCYLSTINDNDYVKDTISNTIAFLSAASTIGAAVIASRLFSDWKEEKDFDLKSQYLVEILSGLKPIHTELMHIRSKSYNIKKTEKQLVLYEKYLINSINLYNTILSTYPSIKIYCSLSKDNELEKIYNRIDKKLYDLDILYSELILKYKRYITCVKEAYERDPSISIDQLTISNPTINFSKKYDESIKIELYGDISKIKVFFDSDKDLTIYTPKPTPYKVKYMDFIEEILKDYEHMIGICIKKIDINSP